MTDDAQQAFEHLADRLARRIVELQLAPAALFFLESSKPLSYIASQALIVLEPIVRTVFDSADYGTFRKGLERRENVELLIRRIEDLEDKRILAGRRGREEGKGKRGRSLFPATSSLLVAVVRSGKRLRPHFPRWHGRRGGTGRPTSEPATVRPDAPPDSGEEP